MKDDTNIRCSTLFLRMAFLGLLLGLSTLVVTAGCSNSASMRYRTQHQNGSRLLHDNTVEQLQSCVEEFGDQVSADSLPVGATVLVDREGRIHDVTVMGIPASAPDLASCTRIALRNMIVPDLPLRSNSRDNSANVTSKHTGNEIGNPAVLVEVAILLGEFVAQHGGKVILYTVTIQVLSALAVEGYKKLSLRCQKVKEQCISSCTEATLPTGWLHGVPFHKCMRDCMESAGCYQKP